MNPTQLLAHFDRISEAPDAVARLRRFILDLAVRGKLVEQDPSDEPAAELLKRIQAEKTRLVKVGAIRKQEQLSEVNASDELFKIPASWCWVRLSHVLTKLTDGTHHSPPNEPEGEFMYVTAKNIKPEGISVTNITYVSAEVHSEIYGRCNPEKGDILYIKDGATTGVVTINNLDQPFSMLSSVALLKLSTCLNNRLVVEFLRSPFFYGQMRGFMKGAAIPRVTLKRMAPAHIPLPPLAEQHRIVAKVDELMALCDELAAAQIEREVRRDQLVAASLNHIGTAPAAAAETVTENQTATSLHDAARFHLNHLPRLTTRPEHIKQLRQTILKLAVCGQLSHVDEWQTRPESLSTFIRLQNGYAFKSEWFVPKGVRLLRNANVTHGTLRWEELVCLPENQADQFEKYSLNAGDIVLSLDRPFIVTGTKVARVREQDIPCLLLQRVGRFQFDPNRISGAYLFLWLHSPQFTSQIDPGRSNGVPHISSKQVEAALILVPPLAEQHRIVARVDELMALCDQLETQLTTTQTDSRRLLEAVLRDVLETIAVATG